MTNKNYNNQKNYRKKLKNNHQKNVRKQQKNNKKLRKNKQISLMITNKNKSYLKEKEKTSKIILQRNITTKNLKNVTFQNKPVEKSILCTTKTRIKKSKKFVIQVDIINKNNKKRIKILII